MRNKKISILSFILVGVLLSGCANNKDREPTQEDVWEEIGTISNALFDTNEEQFFKIAFNMNQLITDTNNMIMFYENELQSNKELNLALNDYEYIKKDSDAIRKKLEQSKTLINELEYSKENQTHDDALKEIIKQLEDGLKEFESSLNYYESFLVEAFDFKTEEERKENVEVYLNKKEEYKIVLKGHIEKMQSLFENASKQFVIEIGLFKKDYNVDTYSANLEKYFEENLSEEQKQNN